MTIKQKILEAAKFQEHLYVNEGKNYQRSARFENDRLQKILTECAERLEKCENALIHAQEGLDLFAVITSRPRDISGDRMFKNAVNIRINNRLIIASLRAWSEEICEK